MGKEEAWVKGPLPICLQYISHYISHNISVYLG